MLLALEVLDQSGCRRSKAAHPFHLFGPRSRCVENAIRELAKRVRLMRLIDREAPYQYAADAIRSFHVLVLPCSFVTRGGRQYLDVVAKTQLLGEKAAGVLGATGDLTAVTRCDEGELHAVAPRTCDADLPDPRWSASTTGPDGNSSSTCAAGRS